MPESPKMHLFSPETDPFQDVIDNATYGLDTPSENRPNSSASPANPEAYLPPTLETRKKKNKPETKIAPAEDVGNDHATSNTDVHIGNPTKFGSKRKFSLDDDILSDLAPEDDDFQFSRLSRSPQKQRDSLNFMARESSPSKTPVNMKRGSANLGTTKRKVLEPSKNLVIFI